MCLIIVRPPKAEIPEEHIREGFHTNGDGAGYMFVRNGRLHIVKGFTKIGRLLKAYRRDVADNDNSYFVMHMRISTSGKTDCANCHPFYLKNHQAGFCHNGILPLWEIKGSDKSDTRHFASQVLERLPRFFWQDPGYKSVLETIAKGTSSKFALLLPTNQVVLYNEEAGHWEGGVWYSNRSYESWGFGFSGKGYAASYYDWKTETEEDVEIECEFCNATILYSKAVEIGNSLVCRDCAYALRPDLNLWN